MQFNTAPSGTLFANVSIKTKPYSSEPVSVRIVADVHANATANKSLYYVELPLQNITMLCIQSQIAKLQANANAQAVSVKIQPKLCKKLQKTVDQ